MVLISYGTYINSCFEWESKKRSLISFLVRNSLRVHTHTNKSLVVPFLGSFPFIYQTQNITKHKSNQVEPDLHPVTQNSSLHPQLYIEL